jgi:hypothetical protein
MNRDKLLREKLRVESGSAESAHPFEVDALEVKKDESEPAPVTDYTKPFEKDDDHE